MFRFEFGNLENPPWNGPTVWGTGCFSHGKPKRTLMAQPGLAPCGSFLQNLFTQTMLSPFAVQEIYPPNAP